jgi:hypothetical protein
VDLFHRDTFERRYEPQAARRKAVVVLIRRIGNTLQASKDEPVVTNDMKHVRICQRANRSLARCV